LVDGAQMSPMPLVPCDQVTTSRPDVGAAVGGTKTMPVTATFLPSIPVETYITR